MLAIRLPHQLAGDILESDVAIADLDVAHHWCQKRPQSNVCILVHVLCSLIRNEGRAGNSAAPEFAPTGTVAWLWKQRKPACSSWSIDWFARFDRGSNSRLEGWQNGWPYGGRASTLSNQIVAGRGNADAVLTRLKLLLTGLDARFCRFPGPELVWSGDARSPSAAMARTDLWIPWLRLPCPTDRLPAGLRRQCKSSCFNITSVAPAWSTCWRVKPGSLSTLHSLRVKSDLGPLQL